MKTALLIPIYEPGEKVVPFLQNFKEADFDFFLAVDDGSGEKFKDVFEAISSTTVFQVHSYPNNKGKGRALKEGMGILLEQHPDIDIIVTSDSDGQHAYPDILAVKEKAIEEEGKLVMGGRDFSGKDIPFKSRYGNGFSALYFRLSTGVKIKDTQTGLRAIPKDLFQLALETPGERFDYEMNFLMDAVKLADVVVQPIATIYEEGEHITHFKAFSDSVRIYRKPLLYVLVALASWGIDVLAFYLLSTYAFPQNAEMQVFLSAIIARITSGVFNFLLLNFLVFRGKGGQIRKPVRYAILWTINLALSSSLTYAFKFVPMALTFVKVIIDTFLTIANYFINMGWVFAKKRRKRK